MSDSRAPSLYFDPDLHPDDTLKSFVEFVQEYELRYSATYPDPPKVSLDASIQRWKFGHENASPSMLEYDTIVEGWKSKDMVAKFLGIYSSRRLYSDWTMAEPDEAARKAATWAVFKVKIQEYYKPTENLTLKNFQFRALSQEKEEAFVAFCNRVEKEAKHCEFKCANADCTAESTAVRDQIVIGTSCDEIREEALKNSWDLVNLRKEGMRLESAAKGASEISGDSRVNRVGKYSFKNTKNKDSTKAERTVRTASCFFCGISGPRHDILAHAKACPAKSSVCTKCNTRGHYAKVCSKKGSIKEVQPVCAEEEISEPLYNVNIFRVEVPDLRGQSDDFKVELLVNNHLDAILADTGAVVSVCGMSTARKWDLVEKMCKTNVKIKPYKSDAIPVIGVSTCGVSFGDRTVPVRWHIIEESCEPILAGKKASHLGIIQFKSAPEVLMPLRMIKLADKELQEKMQSVIASVPAVFKGVGHLKDHVVKLLVDKDVKPVAEPPRRIPYHLKSRVDHVISDMLAQDVIEEHPKGEHAPWVSNMVIAPKDDGDIRITLDAKNVNKALLSSNFPIPRQEDIKAKLSGKKVFSKLDLKSAFWQLEIAEENRHLTVFHSGGRLFRYKMLVMGLKPAQGELNAALQPLFAHLPDVDVIHDDIVISTENESDHVALVDEVLRIISRSGLTLNANKCVFGADEIKFWGLIFSAEGVRPDPEKVEALDSLTTPQSKEELVSFLCMMQSNADFIPGFSKQAALLRDLTKKDCRFKWEPKHETCFRSLISSFRKDVLLRYFDSSLNTFIFVDGHQTGLGAMLAQGNTVEDAKPVAVASRATSVAERNYPQLDLEAASLDFGLRRFKEYVVASPTLIKVVTDHKPLVHIFNGRRNGSIRTQRIKLNHQDVPYIVEYRKGSLNQTDYMSRRARKLSTLPKDQQLECHELNNLLYTLHTTPVIDHIGLAEISRKTSSDAVLSKVQVLVREGKRSVLKQECEGVRKFEPILSELTITANGILLKGERIVLPDALQADAIKLAHRGSHPGQSGIERRLRYHFFFHGMFDKVKKFVQQCRSCSLFVDKKTKEPINHHVVPEKCWDTVAVDLFGPMPSSRHVVVVQDLSSRYPAAKLVSSTKGSIVIPALDEIYGEYGYPDVQISDNGPPFNGREMKDYTEGVGIAARFSSPYFPSQNPAETFMKTVGKAMKVAKYSKASEATALQSALTTYRQTPHPSTGIPPAGALFRDGVKSHFPRKAITEEEIEVAREKDRKSKVANQEKVNASKYRARSEIVTGDVVLVRDCDRKSKFSPIFLPDPFEVKDIDEVAKKVILEGIQFDKVVIRHLDDVKPFHGELHSAHSSAVQPSDVPMASSEGEAAAQKALMDNHADDYLVENDTLCDESDGQGPRTGLRRSTRTRCPPIRYPNDSIIDPDNSLHVAHISTDGQDQARRPHEEAEQVLPSLCPSEQEVATGASANGAEGSHGGSN